MSLQGSQRNKHSDKCKKVSEFIHRDHDYKASGPGDRENATKMH